MDSYSQLGEDIFVLQNFINVPRNDIVLYEVGAYDGRTYSNTMTLEKFCNCKCVLVEPSPVNVRKIYAARPTASVHRVAVSREFGICEFVGHQAVSGASSHLSPDYIHQWNLGNAEKYQVLTAPLGAIFAIENTRYIDFISIDVQGAEFDALCSIDWTIPIGVMCIELEGSHPREEEACREMLRHNGFEFRQRLHISEFWYHPDYFRRNEIFDRKSRRSIYSYERKFFSPEWFEALKSHFY